MQSSERIKRDESVKTHETCCINMKMKMISHVTSPADCLKKNHFHNNLI